MLFSTSSICGKVSQQSLRADLGPKGFVGGQGSPPRKCHRAAQVLPTFLFYSRNACLMASSRSANTLRLNTLRYSTLRRDDTSKTMLSFI